MLVGLLYIYSLFRPLVGCHFTDFFSMQLTPAAGGAVNGYDAVVGITQGVTDLQFEEDDEEAFYMKDLPKHACA